MNGIDVTADYDAVKIRIGGLLHVHFKRSDYLSVQSWIDGDRNAFCIEYVLTGGALVTCEYDRRDVWEHILKRLDTLL